MSGQTGLSGYLNVLRLLGDEVPLQSEMALEASLKELKRKAVETLFNPWKHFGAKKDKTHITITLTCNASRIDLFQLLILGHAVKPHCFKKKTGKDLSFFYMSNKKVWMTGDFF